MASTPCGTGLDLSAAAPWEAVHGGGCDTRRCAEELVTRLEGVHRRDCRTRAISTQLGSFLTGTWLPRKRAHVRSTTAYRYGWMIDHYVIPRLGPVELDALRTEDLDELYEQLLSCGGRAGATLSPKTVHETHLIMRNALDLAVNRRLVDHNVALAVHSPRHRRGGTIVARVWSAQELGQFLAFARPQRLHPALHLVAHTGMRRGELVGLKWRDLDPVTLRLSVCRTIQSLAGTPTEFGAKTRTSRRCIDLDDTTIAVLRRWRRQLRSDALPHGPDDWMFCNTRGRHLNPESIAQLFARVVHRSGLPRIRFHDLRHTHASLLVAAGVPIKVVSERLGHAHPAFTMHTYQHLLPGMGADAAARFAELISSATR